ncbi:hypothetical protein [Micropruina sp.]|uniref:hypothetical protein n=1 Tax=Micropruina sp. TaxID=2737536 RepID=UPI0039E6B1E0
MIEITAVAASPEAAAKLANETAAEAISVVPRVLNGGAKPIARLAVIKSAAVPSSPTTPNTRRVLVLAVAAGLLGGVALAVVRFALDTRIRRAEDLRGGGFTVLGVIAHTSRRHRHESDPLRHELLDGQYRALRVAVRQRQTQARSILVAPVASPAGGTRTAAGLAMAYAHAQQHTLLIDVSERNHDTRSSVGATADALDARSVLSAAIVPTIHPLLDMLACGALGEPQADALASPQFAELIRDLTTNYDQIVVYAPPLATSSDAMVVATAVNATLVTVDAGRDDAKAVTRATESLTSAGAAPLGVVLTVSGSRRSAGTRGGTRKSSKAAILATLLGVE